MWAEKILRGQRKEGGWCQPIICPANLPETLTLENSSWLKDVHAHWRGPWVRPHMHMSKRTGWGDLENCPHMRELSHSYGAKITLSPPVDSSTCMSLLINALPASQSLSLCWTLFSKQTRTEVLLPAAVPHSPLRPRSFKQPPRKWGPGRRGDETISCDSYPNILPKFIDWICEKCYFT